MTTQEKGGDRASGEETHSTEVSNEEDGAQAGEAAQEVNCPQDHGTAPGEAAQEGSGQEGPGQAASPQGRGQEGPGQAPSS
jgi:hypothetical protein